MCYNLLNSQNIPAYLPYELTTVKMVGNKDNSELAEKAAEVARKKEQ